MSEKTALGPSPDAIASYKRRVAARVAEIKRDLAQWIKQTTSFGDYTAVTTALLELAFDRHLDLYGEEDARDLIERAFRRLVQRRRGPLQ